MDSSDEEIYWGNPGEDTNLYMNAYRVLGSIKNLFQKYNYMGHYLKMQTHQVLRAGGIYSSVL